MWRRVAWDNSVLRRFRAGRQVLALRTKDNSVLYSRGSGVDVATTPAQPVQLDGDEFGEAVRVNDARRARRPDRRGPQGPRRLAALARRRSRAVSP